MYWKHVSCGLLSMCLAAGSAQMRAQTGHVAARLTIPAGQSMPLGFNHGITAGKTAPGTPVSTYTTQRVPVSADTFLPPGVKLLGVVKASDRGQGGQSSRLTLEFSELRWHGQRLPVRVQVVAAANKVWVEDAYLPTSGFADRVMGGAANWTTTQVGGDVLMRSGWSGPLINGRSETVGFADFHGIYANPPKNASKAALPRALGPFSAEAAGPYGYGDSATLSDEGGTAVLAAPGKLEIRRGDELLVRVLAVGANVGKPLR